MTRLCSNQCEEDAVAYSTTRYSYWWKNQEVQKVKLNQETEPQVETAETDETELEAEADDDLLMKNLRLRLMRLLRRNRNSRRTTLHRRWWCQKEELRRVNPGYSGQSIFTKNARRCQLETSRTHSLSFLLKRSNIELQSNARSAFCCANTSEIYLSWPDGLYRAKMNYDKELGVYNRKSKS